MSQADEREILTVGEMSDADRAAAAAGTPVYVLMERAGAAVAREVAARFASRPVLVLCGPGDNGGDGYVAARHLREAGWSVCIASTVEVERLKGAAARAAAVWGGPVANLAEVEISVPALVIDALFGAGLKRPLARQVREAMKALQARRIPLVAIDLPSGLPGDTGPAVRLRAFGRADDHLPPQEARACA